MKILVIDDCKDHHNLLTAYCKKLNIDCYHRYSLADAIGEEDFNSFDYILVDRIGVSSNYKVAVELINDITGLEKVIIMSISKPPEVKVYDNVFILKENIFKFLKSII